MRSIVRTQQVLRAQDVRQGEEALLCVRPPSTTTLVLIRFVDMVFSSVALLLLLPVFLIIAAAIKFTSRGPVLFIQKRVGRGGREFDFYKFRSMVHDAEQRRLYLTGLNERNGPVFKMRRDPRITPVGRFLRRYSLDELPQLLNVLKGDMSLVGPRPALPQEVATYTARQRLRLAVTPGLTGLWQISGRAELSFEESIELDLSYVQDMSLGLNLRLICLTLPAVLSGKGAY